ncbi:MAG: right-handed parallel beta-helix repeat-containing protein [Planctomycetia bacterium]|nr:right-handed parallel beta-helix repeat-containing protein [Planctomycetia bacterium]
MKNSYYWLFLLLIVYFQTTFLSAQEMIYVSPNGNDLFSGLLQLTNSDETDGPVATLERALEILAEKRTAASETDAKQWGIELADGVYELNKTLEINSKHNGVSLEKPTIIRAAQGSFPVISGGQLIQGWETGADGRWRVVLEDVKNGHWNFIQLFVNNQQRFRPKLPKQGTYFVTERLDSPLATGRKGDTKFRFKENEIQSHWHNLSDIEVLVFHQWTMSRNLIESVDDQNKIVTVQGSSPSNSSWGHFSTGHRYYLENVAEALSEPGQWYLDRPTGQLTYIPLPGETPENTQIVAPKIEYLMNIVASDGKFVENISLEGLTFAFSNWTTPKSGNNSPQAEVDVDSCIRLAGAINCSFKECAFRNLGHYGIAFGTACHSDSVISCEMKDIGAGAIRIGGDLYQTHSWPYESIQIDFLNKLSEEERIVSDILIQNNSFSALGRLHPAGIGVWIGHACRNKILNNEISDLYYSAVSVGWVWGYSKSVAHSNEICNNHLFNIGQGLLSDMGAVYTLGISPGTKVNHNLIHDVSSFDYGGWGLYTDEGSTGIEMAFNIVYNTKTGSFHQHYGRDNKLFNNILVQSKEFQLQRTRMEEHNSFDFVNNIVYWDNSSPLLGSNWSDNRFVLDRNLYFNPNHEILFAGMKFDEWQKNKNQDVHSLIADPKFKNIAEHDFELSEDSPAWQLGFKPITNDFGTTSPVELLKDFPEVLCPFPLPEVQ